MAEQVLRSMEGHIVKDDVFGQMNRTDDGWETTISLPYFRGFGKRIHLTAKDRQEIPSERQIPLAIDTSGKRRPPSLLQKEAWKKIQARGSTLWNDAMDALIAEYLRQRPMRLRYWQVLHGNRLVSKSLPETVDRAVMKQLVLPFCAELHDVDEEHQTVDFRISFLATWWSEGINVYVREGGVTEVTAMGSTVHRKSPWIDTAEFGRLRRKGNKMPWAGSIQLEAFRDFAGIAVDRELWDENYSSSDSATSTLPWQVSTASLLVYTQPNKRPSARQAATFAEFLKGQQTYAATIIDAIFQIYQQGKSSRRAHPGSAPDPLRGPVFADLVKIAASKRKNGADANVAMATGLLEL